MQCKITGKSLPTRTFSFFCVIIKQITCSFVGSFPAGNELVTSKLRQLGHGLLIAVDHSFESSWDLQRKKNLFLSEDLDLILSGFFSNPRTLFS